MKERLEGGIDDYLSEVNAAAALSALVALFSGPALRRVQVRLKLTPPGYREPIEWVWMLASVNDARLRAAIGGQSRAVDSVRVLGGDVGRCHSLRYTPARTTVNPSGLTAASAPPVRKRTPAAPLPTRLETPTAPRALRPPQSPRGARVTPPEEGAPETLAPPASAVVQEAATPPVSAPTPPSSPAPTSPVPPSAEEEKSAAMLAAVQPPRGKTEPEKKAAREREQAPAPEPAKAAVREPLRAPVKRPTVAPTSISSNLGWP